MSKHKVCVYVSTTYTYDVPEGVDLKEYIGKILDGDVDASEKDSRTQDFDVYELNAQGQVIKNVNYDY